MFRGEVEYNVDDKNRVLVPVKFRQELGETVVLVRGINGQINVYPKPYFDAKLVELEESGGADEAPFTLRLMRAANDCEVDRQGRIVLPPVLRRHAQIGAEVIIVGNGDRVEIWNPDIWLGAYNEWVKQLSGPADKLEGLTRIGMRP